VPFAALPTTFWGSTQQQGNTAAGGAVVPATTAVVYEGSVVDIRQTMQLLSRLQQQVNEQTQVQVALTSELSESFSRRLTAESVFSDSVKEVRDTLTKRKKRLEDDLDRYKKKLSSAETSVKVSMRARTQTPCTDAGIERARTQISRARCEETRRAYHLHS